MLAISSFSDGKSLGIWPQVRLGQNPGATGNYTESMLTKHCKVQTQGRNIRHYTNYLSERARGYRDTKCDFVRGGERRLEKMSIDKGLLRETEVVQHQITALLKCDVSLKKFRKGHLLILSGPG